MLILFMKMKTFLSSLHELRAQNNKLSILERDFYGLPTLCYANLANNEIKSLSFDLVSRTRCKLHGIPDILKINLQGYFFSSTLSFPVDYFRHGSWVPVNIVQKKGRGRIPTGRF